MRASVLYAGFTLGIVAFVAWMTVMLRHERERHRAGPPAHGTPAPAPAPAALRPVVRAGSYCRVPGNVGVTKHGAALVCRTKGDGRPRWRRPPARVAAERAA